MLEQGRRGEHLVLLDFGSARTYVSNESKTMTGVVTSGYSPQEQYSQKRQQGPYTDVYALCATMYHAITGVLPPASIERALEGIPLKSFEECGIIVPKTVERAIMHGMALKSAERTQTMGQLLEELGGENAADINEDKIGEQSPKHPSEAKVYESKPINRSNQQGETNSVQPETVTQRKSEKKPSALPKFLAGIAAGLLLFAVIYFGILQKPDDSAIKQEVGKETVEIWTEPTPPLEPSATSTTTPTPTPTMTPEEKRMEERYQTALAKLESSSLEDRFDSLAILLELGDYKDAEARSEELINEYGGLTAIGHQYWEGQDVVQDYDKAMEWYQKAAEFGDPDGMCRAGVMYQTGRGVSKDYEKAMEWYLKATELGSSDAMDHIGTLYECGLGVPQDDSKAMEWYLKAAELGDAWAMYHIAYMYCYAEGIDEDYEKAMEWYLKAAELGNTWAMNRIGDMYRVGKGVGQDYEKAMDWYLEAAALSDESSAAGAAMNRIGKMYESAEGVTKDYDKALKWFQKATELGDEEAKQNMERLKRWMSTLTDKTSGS